MHPTFPTPTERHRIVPTSSRLRPPTRIALVTTELGMGGAERNLVRLATRLSSDQFCVEFYSLDSRPTEKGTRLVEQLQQHEIPTHFLDLKRSTQLLTGVNRLTAHFRRQQPDLVQTFLFHANILGAMAARRAGIDRLVGGLRVAEPRRWRGWLLRRMASRFDRFVCVSRDVAGHAEHRVHLPAENLLVIPNGIELDQYPAPERSDLTSLGLGPGRRAIVFVGRLEAQKDPIRLVDLATKFLRDLPDHDLVIVGDGPLREPLRRHCHATELDSRIHLLGRRDDVPQILAAADLLVVPSRWEGMPNVLLEAMASQLPVAAVAVEGVGELLGPLASRQTAPPDDDEAFCRLVVDLAADRREAEAIGLANRQRAERHFSVDTMVQGYSELYEGLVRRDR